MIRIAICDDDISSADSAYEIINNFHNKDLYIDVFYSSNEFLSSHESYNIYLLDIEMEDKNGIEIASIIRKNSNDAVIIFITNYEQYVFDVFEVLPFRFIRKPVHSETLLKCITDAVRHIKEFGQIFFFQMGHKKYQLNYNEIIYFESCGRKVLIHTSNETYEIYDKISNISSKTDSQIFCQIHASFIVNMNCIRSIRKTEILLNSNITLPISRRYHDNVKYSHLSFIERQCMK